MIDAVVLPVQRKNLAEVAKMLQQISSGKVFDNNDLFLAPLNEFVLKTAPKFSEWFMKCKSCRQSEIEDDSNDSPSFPVTDVEEPETYFDIHEMNDQISTRKPVVYISPYELFHLHYAIEHNLDDLEPRRHGPLSDIIRELGPSPYHPNLELPESLLCLTLSHPSDGIPMDAAARQQQLLVDAKRLVTYIIKIQGGATLKKVLRAPVTEQEEDAWEAFKQAEFSNPIHAKRRYIKLGHNDPPLDLQR